MNAVQYGGLSFLEILLDSPQAEPITAKLRSAGVDAFRFLLDNPLVLAGKFGMDTGVQVSCMFLSHGSHSYLISLSHLSLISLRSLSLFVQQATKIAAFVWGRMDDTTGGGLTFKQQDIDNVVPTLNIRVIQSLQFAPVHWSVYHTCVPRSRYRLRISAARL